MSREFCLLLLHPSLLAWKYAQTSVMRAAHLWFPGTAWALTAGQLALYLMVPLMITTLFVTVRHQVLVWTQRALGLIFLPAAQHVLWAGGDTRRYAPLRIVIVLLVAAGLAALLFHTVLGRFTTRQRRYRVIKVTQAPSFVTELLLQPIGGAMPFVPGQFAFLRFVIDLASAPAPDERFELIVTVMTLHHIAEPACPDRRCASSCSTSRS